MFSALRIAALALCAVFAIGAAPAHGAEFHTENPETTVTGGYLGEIATEAEVFKFNTNEALSPCYTANFQGAMATQTTSSLALTASFGFCFFPVTMGGCEFILKASGELAITGASCATKPIEINREVCKIFIGPQENLGGEVSYVNEGSGTERVVRATFNINGIDYSQTAGLPCKGGPGNFTNGKLTGITTLSAHQLEIKPKQRGLWIE